MCCVFLLFGFFGPRTALVYLWLTNYLSSAFQTTLWPLLGFLFMPFATLAYAVAMHNGGLTNFWLLIVILGALVDLGVIGGSERHRRSRQSGD